MKLKIDPRAARLRHARYYQQVAHRANFELYDKGKQLEGLALFDQERSQIDMVWEWVMVEPHSTDIDQLLIIFANATVHVGELRYDRQRERIPQLEAQREAARRLKQREEEGAALTNLGLAYAELGEYHQALLLHEQFLVIARETGNQRGEGAALGNLGMVYLFLGNYQKAIEYNEQYRVIAHKIGDHKGVGTALSVLGNSCYFLGEYQRAIDYHEQYLVIAREVGRIYQLGGTPGNRESNRPFSQQSRRCSRWVKPSSLQRMPTPVNRC
jgi:tetratricopeptide (TPR) repeat protein